MNQLDKKVEKLKNYAEEIGINIYHDDHFNSYKFQEIETPSKKAQEKMKICNELALPYKQLRNTAFHGNICLSNIGSEALQKFEKLEVNTVYGDFIIKNQQIFTLKGCPEIVSEDFVANQIEIKNCIGMPEHIGSDCRILDNPIKSLEGFAKQVDGDLYISFDDSMNVTDIHVLLEEISSQVTGSIFLKFS